ncbi:hypothetical protein BS47DRAFT_1324770 [Hydnum rufescens UP504]|uniref:Bola-like protein n=1 Tax=Hydnum rufescens UP504 TaxID=1448309 RepID=A0A9P6B8F8_9AGAM|nr:hypothetical protein BS47DRAFT_1324770 [Hydnum rufescens UP504]
MLFPHIRLVGLRTRPSPAFLGLRWSASSSVSPAQAGPLPTEGEQQIIDRLTARFTPSRLAVQDVSGGCGTFYAITISSMAFKGLSTLKQHRLVTQELKEEVKGIHGLQIKTIPE